jgi:uncharacterized protein YjbI with pentapeptide repeats
VRVRSAWVTVGAFVVLLISAGLALTAASGPTDAAGNIGVAMTAGGITGLVFVLAESVLARRDAYERLLLQLSLSEDLRAVNLKGKRIDDLALVGKSLAVADLSRARLRRARLVGADLRWSSMAETDLEGAVLVHATLDDVDLRYSSLCRVNMKSASLQRANFEGARLDLADLSGANLEGAQLEGAVLRRIAWDSETIWPSGFTPPPSDPAVPELFSGGPDWDDYWARFGREPS